MALPEMRCIACHTPLERDPLSGNYRCPKEGCGKGSLTASGGITTTVSADGKHVVFKSGNSPS